MRLQDLYDQLGMSGEEALRILHFARKQKLTLDVAMAAIAAARDMVEYELPPGDQTDGGPCAGDTECYVPAVRDGKIMLGAYVPHWQRDELKKLALRTGKSIEALVEQALLDLFDRHAADADN